MMSSKASKRLLVRSRSCLKLMFDFVWQFLHIHFDSRAVLDLIPVPQRHRYEAIIT